MSISVFSGGVSFINGKAHWSGLSLLSYCLDLLKTLFNLVLPILRPSQGKREYNIAKNIKVCFHAMKLPMQSLWLLGISQITLNLSH